MKSERRGGEDIKKSILEYLDKGPSSVKGISDSIGGNWITVSNYLEELKKEKKVKEVISTDKLKFYQKITGDTYFDIPITDEQRKWFKYLFSLVISEFKDRKGKLPTRTQLAKIVVDLIFEQDLKLPVVWYIYGQIPLMIPDPTKDYSIDFQPHNHNKIRDNAIKIIDNCNHKDSQELKLDHYAKYKNKLYEIKELLLKNFDEYNEEKIIDLLNKFYIACPVSEHTEIFDLVERYISVVNKMKLISVLNKNKINAILSLEALWKYIATYQLLDSLSKSLGYTKEDITLFYLGPFFESRKQCADESISNLESIYISNLTNKEIELSEEESELRGLMSDWTGE